MAKRNSFKILFQDDSVIVVDKVAGLSVNRERDQKIVACLIDKLSQHIKQDLLLVHRIDKETSGVVLFAKTKEAQQKLSEQFMNGTVKKKYLAIVSGKLHADSWESIDKAIFKKENDIKVQINPKGKKALTRYITLEHFNNCTLMDVEIISGRTHQIRVHFASIGHPLLVDRIYGTKSEFFLSEILKRPYRTKAFEIERPLMKRQTLHAASIAFKHPESEKTISFNAEVPKDWRALINQLRKHQQDL